MKETEALQFFKEIGGEQTNNGAKYRIPRSKKLYDPSTLRYIKRKKAIIFTTTTFINEREDKKYYKEIPVMSFKTIDEARLFLEFLK